MGQSILTQIKGKVCGDCLEPFVVTHNKEPIIERAADTKPTPWLQTVNAPTRVVHLGKGEITVGSNSSAG